MLGVPFEVIAPEFAEHVSAHLPICEEVLQFAVGKAQSVAAKNPGSIVIGSDTMIQLGDRKIGKPNNEDDARRMLGLLSGKTHKIHTGVAIIDGMDADGLRTVETVRVIMRKLSSNDIERYLAAGESLDKAGAYSIQGQGRDLIAAMEGDYLAAVGMPLRPIADYLTKRGLACIVDKDKVLTSKPSMSSR